MINYIKDAVTAVSGIKTFLFNTDYRNNFDLQNVEFPCCVLTPIMRTNYDLNNIIRESAELQLSVVDLAPYEYTGDDLYAINKRCSDLALQVISNLQVKSKLDKELTFEFILPSGDELISGVMCNLTATMKQGYCIGAPSYVEVIVQPIKKESITSNGKHVISPSKGFNAMREVEVDVNVDLKGSLQDKQVTIIENGTQTIVADEGFDGLSSVEVNANVHGTGFSVLDGGEFQDEFNNLIAQKVTASNLASLQAEGNITYKFRDNTDILYIISDKGVSGNSAFTGCTELRWLKVTISSGGNLTWATNFGNNKIIEIDYTIPKNASIKALLMTLTNAKKITINGRSDILIFDMEGKVDIGDLMRGSSSIKVPVIIPNGVTSATTAFNNCKNIPYIDLGEVSNNTFSSNVFSGCSSLATLKFTKWGKNNIPLNMTSVLTAESIHYIIQNAMSLAEGATARTLTLHATAKANWEASEYYQEDLAVLEAKGITIA
jgi:hypothetical protein